MARSYKRDSSGRFAGGGGGSGGGGSRSVKGQAQAAQRRRDPGGQSARGAARARDNSDSASANMRLARQISTGAPKSATALRAYNAKLGKKASRSKRTAERARKVYKAKPAG
jgi:hypothetical protein